MNILIFKLTLILPFFLTLKSLKILFYIYFIINITLIII